MGGFRGKLLFIDLTEGVFREEALPESIYRRFMGGTGLGARILYERMKPGVDPLGPGNMLGLVPGLLEGSTIPMATKYSVVAKSPLTNTWGNANSGGLFGSALKKAGYDALFFSGRAEKPVFLIVDDQNVELRDAQRLWGKDTVETVESLREETGEKRLRISCIGPAGESCSLISSVVTDNGRVAGRSGLGAVMGSKLLKAVAVKGSGAMEAADKEAFHHLREETRAHLGNLDQLPFLNLIGSTGTCGGLLALVPPGASPIKNWRHIGQQAFPDFGKIGGENIAKYEFKKSGCGNCPINCGGLVQVKRGPFAALGRKPEYETLAAFGTMLLNSNPESIIKANEICDRFGMDTISSGSVIAFAMECYEKGVIGQEEAGGIQLNWGNPDAIIGLLEKIAKREGLGEYLADGVERAGKRIGKGSEKWAIHVHGQEPGYHDPRLFDYRGLGYITGAAPGRHMVSAASIRMERVGKMASYPECHKPEMNDGVVRKGETHALGVSYNQAFSDSGLCLFALSGGADIPLVEIIRSVTGWDITVGELIRIGKRVLTLEQAFNIREGLMTEDFKLPERIARPPKEGPFEDRKVNFDALRESYFRAMGWEAQTGIPTAQCLATLELDDLVDFSS